MTEFSGYNWSKQLKIKVHDLIKTLFQAKRTSSSAHRSIVCLRKSSCYTCCTHCTSVFWKVSSYSSVSASDHRGGLTWSCFLVETAVHAHSRAWLSLHVDKYCDSSCKSSSSHKQKENLSCGKL